ncbi:Bifunctional polymyxin resistance protein ArnA [Planctomycetes bacterium Pan216]|uniref:UDP-glucuronate decarboxylase n=1 Tax=Kolteria novifilia TaxID=2527975 RepID=A0A518B1E5_9BACT|nr:Bifunctional polymyxin resistance protein ArnA [Planctomycetes bacterium Pan216]
MHYLVTGGAGFIGSHLCDRLLANGDQVTVLDDLSTGRYENIAGLEDHPHFRLIVETARNEQLLEGLVRECDAIFHLASVVGVRLVMDRPVQTIEAVFEVTASVLKMASTFRRKVLLASSSEVYGKSKDVPFHEDGDRLEGPTSKHRWAYSCAKALDEFLALAHWKESRLPVVCARLFNTVGPRQRGRYGMVLPRFVAAALAGEPLLVHGDGNQSRCFCHVADVIDGLVGLMNCAEANGNVVNVGSNRETTIGELAQLVVSIVESSSEIKYVKYDEVYGEGFEDMRRRVPDLGRIERLIGWKPRRDINTIISDVRDSLQTQPRSSMP